MAPMSYKQAATAPKGPPVTPTTGNGRLCVSELRHVLRHQGRRACALPVMGLRELELELELFGLTSRPPEREGEIGATGARRLNRAAVRTVGLTHA